jgi:hypothetical protein
MILARCPECRGFLPPSAPDVDSAPCPHCAGDASSIRAVGRSGQSAATSNVGKKILGVVGTSAFAVTLMACYGPPPSHMRRPAEPAPGPGNGQTMDKAGGLDDSPASTPPMMPTNGSTPGSVSEPAPPASASATPFAKPPPR